MERKGIIFILLLIVAVLTLTVAIMAGYLLVAGSAPQNGTTAMQQTEVVPDIKDLGFVPIFQDSQYFNLKIDGSGKPAVIEIKAELVYLKNAKVKDLETKITSSMGKIRELIGAYFMQMTLEDASKPETIEVAKKELTAQINDLLNSGEKVKTNIVWTINFDRWFYAV